MVWAVKSASRLFYFTVYQDENIPVNYKKTHVMISSTC